MILTEYYINAASVINQYLVYLLHSATSPSVMSILHVCSTIQHQNSQDVNVQED
jgi:hypothetical protein